MSNRFAEQSSPPSTPPFATGENPTLNPSDAVVLGRRRRRRKLASSSLKADLARDSRLGYGYLSIGIIMVSSLLFLRGASVFALDWSSYSHPVIAAASWVVLAIVFVAVIVIGNHRQGHLPLPLYLAACAVVAACVIADALLSGASGNPAMAVSTAIGAGTVLLATITFVPLRWSLVSAGGLVAILLVTEVFALWSGEYSIAKHLEGLVVVLAPLLIGISIVRGFGQLIQRELDRSMVESTIAAPRLAFGMLASDELARIDLAAEELLQDVATGRSELPLAPELAAHAAELASELRLLLVAGRNETWLSHAIEESEFLGPVVKLNDDEGLAGYLDPHQRDGLLSAIWLLVGDSSRTQPFIVLTIGPRSVNEPHTRTDSIRFPVDITIDGVPRRKIDSAVWPALNRVGPHTELPTRGQFRIALSVSTVAQDSVR